MSAPLSPESNKVIAAASDAARSFNHAYVGTEHVLLALVEAHSTELPYILEAFNISADKIRAKIERLVTRGTDPIAQRTLPLTPRAKRAIENARQEARFMNGSFVGPEHLFLGLVSEPSGVACRVLRNLGIQEAELRREIFKVRIAQMKIVERAIRPVRAGVSRKRKMREELLAHLAVIYDQEFTRLHDPVAAMKAAANRFGNPSDLAKELQSSLPTHERISHFIEQFVQYRAPESAAHYSFRMAVHTFVALATALGTAVVFVFLRHGWTPEVSTLASVLAAITFATPLAQFVMWWAYIKMRDALWGAFGSRKSPMRVIAFDALIAAVGAIYVLTILVVLRLDGHAIGRDAYSTCGWMSLFAAIVILATARFIGPREISDTQFALLDIAD